jgi:molybdate transport system regulatory protein
MTLKKNTPKTQEPSVRPGLAAAAMGHGRINSGPAKDQCLDTIQLEQLEQAFREWATGAVRADVRQSRRRILLIFLLIRYTGAKLNEVLALDPSADFDFDRHVVFLGRAAAGGKEAGREVHVPESLCGQLRTALIDPASKNGERKPFEVDPAFVRRKFYERSATRGFAKRLGGPEAIRKSRAVELIRGNMPLPAVQAMLGHSSPNLTSSYVAFSDQDIRELTRLFVEREAVRKTSARNAFFGKISAIQRGDIQSRVELTTIGGHSLVTMITNDSLQALGLRQGMLATAEVKAPWVTLQKGGEEPRCSAENRYRGSIIRRNRGAISTEYVVRLADHTELCAIAGTPANHPPDFTEGEEVWAFFNCFSVVLHVR